MQITKITLILLLTLLSLLSKPSSAMDEAVDATALCDKLKECALKEFDSQGLPEQMRLLVIGMIEGQCATVVKSYTHELVVNDLSKKANACIDSITQMSCDDLTQLVDEPQTAACVEFRESADAEGIDLN